MKDTAVIIVKERNRNVAVEVGDESYTVPDQLGALLVSLGYKSSERENKVGINKEALEEYHRKHQS